MEILFIEKSKCYLMVLVTKFDGRKEPFVKEKVYRTCIKMHTPDDIARGVADKVEKSVYEGISTKQILKLIFRYLKEYKPGVEHQVDLREAISMLRPKPDFEIFIAKVLEEYGYSVKSNLIIPGKCVEHEIDTVASKNNETIYVEIKHHFQSHTFTGLGVFLESKATFDDLVDGFKAGKNKFNFSKVLVVCNTKISDHAYDYAECRGIDFIGWKSPNRGLESMITEKKLYPITYMKKVDRRILDALGDANIVLLKQLATIPVNESCRMTGISKHELETLQKRAIEILK